MPDAKFSALQITSLNPHSHAMWEISMDIIPILIDKRQGSERLKNNLFIVTRLVSDQVYI